MESIYAALLLHKASKDITEDAIAKILKAADVDPDKTQIKKLVAGLQEADIESIISAASAAPAAVAAPTGGAGPSGEEAAEKEEEKGEEEEEDEEPAGIGSLF